MTARFITLFEKANLIAVLRRSFINESNPSYTEQVIRDKIAEVLNDPTKTTLMLRRITNVRTDKSQLIRISTLHPTR